MVVNTIKPASEEELIGALAALDVFFLQGRETAGSIDLPLHQLIANLAESNEARIRLALIPLFLRHPDLAKNVDRIAPHLSDSAKLLLVCYYSAAYALQRKYKNQLQKLFGDQESLPDLFSNLLGISNFQSPDVNLRELAICQARLSGRDINWLGTYEHGAQRFLIHLEKRQQWQT